MIERARRGEDITGPKMVDAEETKIIRTDHRGFGYERPMRESRSGASARALFSGYGADPSGAHSDQESSH
mgnify:CR=1 FL=1